MFSNRISIVLIFLPFSALAHDIDSTDLMSSIENAISASLVIGGSMITLGLTVFFYRKLNYIASGR